MRPRIADVVNIGTTLGQSTDGTTAGTTDRYNPVFDVTGNGSIGIGDITNVISKIVNVLSGGMGPSRQVTAQHLLDLEREAFVSLCGEEKTQARIQFMLEKRKPLRN